MLAGLRSLRLGVFVGTDYWVATAPVMMRRPASETVGWVSPVQNAALVHVRDGVYMTGEGVSRAYQYSSIATRRAGRSRASLAEHTTDLRSD